MKPPSTHAIRPPLVVRNQMLVEVVKTQNKYYKAEEKDSQTKHQTLISIGSI